MAAGPSIAELYRLHGAKVLAYLVGRLRDVERAEDALQVALLRACTLWPERGTPTSPVGWLATVGYRAAIDDLRKARREVVVEESVLEAFSDEQVAGAFGPADGPPDPWTAREIPDERLSLIYMLCHPAIAASVRTALVLQELAGFTAVELGRIFLTPPATIGQRLVRAKRKIRINRPRFGVPVAEELPSRTAAVRQVIYHIFTEGHTATRGESLYDTDLITEALRLGRVLVELLDKHSLLAENAESRGLLALMLLTDARRPGRVGREGDLIPLEEQDRSLWNRDRLDEGLSHLDAALACGPGGPFQIEAAIAALHATAPRYDETDWQQMLALYDELLRYKPSPVVRLNRLVVVGETHGPDVALEQLSELYAQAELRTFAPLWLLSGELYRRVGEYDLAHRHLTKALELTANRAERAHIEMKLRGLARE
ncbi:MAG: RNA polymerase sigma factor [Spirochaetales bacterium]